MTKQALLRNKKMMDLYAKTAQKSDPKFAKRYPSEDKWKLLAQYEGILTNIKRVSMQLQTDDPGSNSASLLEIYTAFYHAQRMRMEGEECGVGRLRTDTEDFWDASLTMDDLDGKRDLIAYKDLEPGARLLVRRIIQEYRHYLFNRDPDALKAVCANPLLANVYADMFVNFGVYDQDSVKEGRQIFVQDMVDLHSNRSVSPIGASLANQGAKGSKPNKRTGTGQPKDNNDFVDTESNNATLKYKAIDVFERMRRSSDLKNQAMLHLTGKASNAAEEKEVLQALKKACNDSYDDFIRHWKYQIDNHWEEVIKAYPSKKFSDEYDDWSDVAKRAFSRHCHNRNYLQVGQYFDLMGWWRVHSSNWQYVFPSAVIWLAKPATNAFQERIFSMGSWMLQNKLMGSMSKKTSEMRTMEYINRQVLRTIEENEEEIAKGNGTSKTYDKRIIRKDDTAITAAIRLSLSEQRKKFQKSAVLDAANGFQQYKLSWKVDTSVLDDPDIGSTFFPVQSAKVTKKPTALNDNDDDNSPSGNDIPVPPPEEVPKVAGVMPPIPDDQAEIGQDKTGQDKTGKRYGWPTYGEKTSPLKYNRFVFTNIKDDYEDSSDDDSIPPPPKEPDEESDAVIDHVLDSELWDEAVPDDELCFEKIVCIPDDDPINKAPKGTVNDDDEVKVVKVVPAGENSKSKGTPSPKASISSKKAVAHRVVKYSH